ncbi:MAG: sulfur carrier protein ThiS [Pseudomonadota bacterium]
MKGSFCKQDDLVMIPITVNGEAREVPEGSVAALLTALGLPSKKIAVERNLEIVPRSAFDKTQVCDGDRYEIVQFVGGG